MRDKVLLWCRSEHLFPTGAHVACAVSGGADSMAMLWCLYTLQRELSIKVSAVHFNHNLRGAESERDEQFVRAFCEARGIPLTVGSAAITVCGKSVEEAAREKRYAFFETQPCDVLATAHTADDNVETVLQHLLRGTGLRGLCGIPPRRGRYVRPLLSVSRRQVLAFLQAEGISWVEDATNAEDEFQRNRLRHHVLPLLREETPELAAQVASLTQILRAEDAFLDGQAERLLAEAGDRRGNMTEELFRCRTILAAPSVLQSRALRVLLRRYLPCDVSRKHIEAMQLLLASSSPSAQLSLPGGLLAQRRYDCFTILQELPGDFVPVRLNLSGETRIEALGLRVTCTYVENFKKNANTPFTFAIKYDKIGESILSIRPRKTGDTITLNSGHSVTLKKLFIDRKFPRAERGRIPILATEDAVVAVLGVGADRRWIPAAGDAALTIRVEKEEM